MGAAEMCALATGGALGLISGAALGAAAMLAAPGRRARPGFWRITDEVSGTRTRVLLVRQLPGTVTDRIVVAEVTSHQDWADAYLAARQEATRRLEWLQAREAVRC